MDPRALIFPARGEDFDPPKSDPGTRLQFSTGTVYSAVAAQKTAQDYVFDVMHGWIKYPDGQSKSKKSRESPQGEL